MTIKHDNCKNCRSRCIHAGKDRDFVCVNGVSCKITMEKPQTNAQKIRAMSDEELQRWFCKGRECWNCPFRCWDRCTFNDWIKQTAE